MSGSQTSHVSMLDCFHTAFFSPPPTQGDEVYCSRCGDYRVVATVSAEWRIKCRVCHLGRAYGADEGRARAVAHGHALMYGHEVQLILAGDEVDLISPIMQGTVINP